MTGANKAPTNQLEFLALPIEPNFLEVGVAYFMEEDTLVGCWDNEGVGWMLGRDASGRWYRRRA